MCIQTPTALSTCPQPCCHPMHLPTPPPGPTVPHHHSKTDPGLLFISCMLDALLSGFISRSQHIFAKICSKSEKRLHQATAKSCLQGTGVEDIAAASGPCTGDMTRAVLVVHLTADPELPLASFRTSGCVRWIVVLGWALVQWLTITHPCEGQGDLGLALASRFPPEGWEGTSVGAVKKAGTCTVLLVKGYSI